ncbi:CRISPR-associated protein Csx20 [Caloranaerobacter sp. DY30410]|uniref:CRISPR-associated protein Csx20 n=1 Tax=Caloranaerobacter sp. DY30410 TaxID=3238305 RepID=UPI003D000890
MNLLVILSHELSDFQIEEAKSKLDVGTIKTLPDTLKEIWSNLNPKGELPVDKLNLIRDWVLKESYEEDYVLVQGDFGATFYIVDFCFKYNRIPIYATTARKVEETKVDNKVVTKRVFVHENFRKYLRYKI